MREGTITLGIVIVILTLIIYAIKNKEAFIGIMKKLMKTKIRYVYIGLLVLMIGCILYDSYESITKDLRVYNKNKEYNKIYEDSDRKKTEENVFYKKIANKEYEELNYSKPYLPDGFEHIEGTYEDGFVIQDKNQNQYVWVPCTNKEIAGVSKLEKRNFISPVFISKDSCYDENYEEFLKSAFENGGFYISRFEIGKENNLPVSKSGVEVWSNISKKEAKDIISKMYVDENINCELINGFAYDTALTWIKNNNDIEATSVNIKEKKIFYSGRNQYNKIYDFCDNILEFSTEIFYDNIIVRGFSGSEEEMDYGIKFSDESRYSIFEDDTSVSLTDGIAIRTILYK